MAFTPIAYTIPQYDQVNYWLKAYEPGTTTPKSIATDSTGGTTAARIEIDSSGFPITAGSARFIPFIDGTYDLWAFPTSAEADANDTTNAIQFADNISRPREIDPTQTLPASATGTLGVAVTCKDASVLAFTAPDYQPDDMNKVLMVSSGNSGSGVLCEISPLPTFDLVLPYMVVIGDSIAKGSPALNSRLDPSYNPSFTSSRGQISYELSQLYNIPVINQGIGSQNSTDIRNRWPRDVLAQTFDPGDGRGSNTMDFGGQLPSIVYLHVGANDLASLSEAAIKNNFEFFAESCRDNNINLIVANIGPSSSWSAGEVALGNTINTWLSGEYSTNNPEVQIIDYLNWGSGGTNNIETLKANVFADNIHPSEAGYVEYSNFIYTNNKLPSRLKAVQFSSALDPSGAGIPSDFSRITRFTFAGSEYAVALTEDVFVTSLHLGQTDSPVQTLTALEVTTITDTGAAQYTGFADIRADLGYSVTEVSLKAYASTPGAGTEAIHVQDRKPSSTNGGAAAAGWNLQRALNTLISNNIAGASLVSDQITLPAGTYDISGSAPATIVDRHQMRLYDVTNTATLVVGTAEFCDNADLIQTRTLISGRFVLAGVTTVRVDHYTELAEGTGIGLGVAASTGELEVYTNIKITKVA